MTRSRAPIAAALAMLFAIPQASAQEPAEQRPGYRGIWFELGQVSEYGDKYSGGLGTYTAKHRPIAIHAARAGDAGQTFFVYGGSKEGKRHLLNMIGVYDHATGQVLPPSIVHDKDGVNDPHDNSSLLIDGAGHLWVFVSGRGRVRPGFIYRSRAPYDIHDFELIREREFAYPQPVWIEGRGFLHCFTKYTKGRELYWNRSDDGRTWTQDRKLAGMGGHYQNVEQRDGTVYMAFNYHPGGNVDKRTNLYFLMSEDVGDTWTTVTGEAINPPLTDPRGSGLVRDFESEGRLVYLKDIQFAPDGSPVILVVTSAAHVPGPNGEPRIWTLVRWNGTEWQFTEITQSTHNYDMGQLWIDGDTWTVIAPTEPGPQRWGTGGEVVMWKSRDNGDTWSKEKIITADSSRNHTYVRRPLNAQSDFYALWADGDADRFSESRLYFMNETGDRVTQMPPSFPE